MQARGKATYFWRVYRWEDFPPGDRLKWEALIQKELGHIPEGRPLSLYMRSDVLDWEAHQPLWQEAGWALVSDWYVPEEIAVWRYSGVLPKDPPPRWFVPLEYPLSGPPSALDGLYIEHQIGQQRSAHGLPVWHLPLQLTNELEIRTQGPLKYLPTEQPLHLSLTLDGRFFVNILLLRSLRKALYHGGMREVIFWAKPADTLLAVSEQLPGAGPEENLIRLTTYALSAVLGGAKFVYIPAIQPGDLHAERWSRSISHILQYEIPHLSTVSDPLAGSFFLEAETERLYSAILEAMT